MPKGTKGFEKVQKPCLECGKSLILHNNRDIERKNFCSRICSSKYNYSKCNLNIGMTLEQREQQAKSMRKYWKNHKHPMKGKRHSLESKKKNAESQKKRAKIHPNSYLRGEKHQFWNGGKTHAHGYVLVLAKHPKADMYGKVREHVLVIEKQLGRYLTKDEKVHHINGIKDDNRLENLQLFPSQSEHLKEHWRLRRESQKLKSA